MDAVDREEVHYVLFMAGPEWGKRSPEDIIAALDAADFVIVKRSLMERVRQALYNPFEPENQSRLYSDLPAGVASNVVGAARYAHAAQNY